MKQNEVAPLAVGGIHHITAIAGDPQENLDFYVGVMGLRLVKRSINQDVPDTYHFFFADGGGNPGTDLTFFPWPSMAPRREGASVWGEVSFVVPPGSLGWWTNHLTRSGVRVDEIQERFGEKVLPFRDPHGLNLSLTETETYPDFVFDSWGESPVPGEHQIRALGSVSLTVRDEEASREFLSRALGFRSLGRQGNRHRLGVGEAAGGQRIDLVLDPQAPRGTWGTGAVHHVAFRVPDDQTELLVEQQIHRAGGQSSGVIDRFWFKSVYVREPSGALCEVATDGPGFGVDEDMEHLGETLILPPWYEDQRGAIEQALPAIDLEQARTAGSRT